MRYTRHHTRIPGFTRTPDLSVNSSTTGKVTTKRAFCWRSAARELLELVFFIILPFLNLNKQKQPTTGYPAFITKIGSIKECYLSMIQIYKNSLWETSQFLTKA